MVLKVQFSRRNRIPLTAHCATTAGGKASLGWSHCQESVKLCNLAVQALGLIVLISCLFLPWAHLLWWTETCFTPRLTLHQQCCNLQSKELGWGVIPQSSKTRRQSTSIPHALSPWQAENYRVLSQPQVQLGLQKQHYLPLLTRAKAPKSKWGTDGIMQQSIQPKVSLPSQYQNVYFSG